MLIDGKMIKLIGKYFHVSLKVLSNLIKHSIKEGANLILDQNLSDSNCKNVKTIKVLLRAQRFLTQLLDPKATFIDYDLHNFPTNIILSNARMVSSLPKT